jgi:hypothetical protein
VGSSGFKTCEAMLLIKRYLRMAMLFAFPALFVCKLLKINELMVEAAGVERFFHSLDSIIYLLSIAYETAQRPKMPFSWYSFGTVFD